MLSINQEIQYQILMDIKAEYANLEKDNKIIKVSPEEVKIDDIIIIKPGERVPVDGIVISGNTSIDSSALNWRINSCK